jgi:hypothetical protein
MVRATVKLTAPRANLQPELEATASVTTLINQALTYSHSKLVDNAEKECPPHYRDCLEPQDKSLSVEGCQQYMMECRTVIYNLNEQHTYFLHGHKNGLLVLFSHGGLQAVHHKSWYLDENSPLYDEDLRATLMTTTCPMLAMSAVGVRDL